MTIKEVSEKYNISQDTLRYYERVGMIPPVTRTAGGIRDYQESDLGWVELAICMRSGGAALSGRRRDDSGKAAAFGGTEENFRGAEDADR